MASVNKVIIVGNLGNDPEVKTFENGGKVATISVATSERWNDRQTGEQREQTEWHRIVFYSRVAEIVEQYLRKGSSVYVEGRLQTRKWQDQNGQDRYSTEIIGANMQMLGGRNGGGDYQGGGYQNNYQGGQQNHNGFGGHGNQYNGGHPNQGGQGGQGFYNQGGAHQQGGFGGHGGQYPNAGFNPNFNNQAPSPAQGQGFAAPAQPFNQDNFVPPAAPASFPSGSQNQFGSAPAAPAPKPAAPALDSTPSAPADDDMPF